MVVYSHFVYFPLSIVPFLSTSHFIYSYDFRKVDKIIILALKTCVSLMSQSFKIFYIIFQSKNDYLHQIDDVIAKT